MSGSDEVAVVDEGGAAVELPAVGEGHEPGVLAGVRLVASYDAAASVGCSTDWGKRGHSVRAVWLSSNGVYHEDGIRLSDFIVTFISRCRNQLDNA